MRTTTLEVKFNMVWRTRTVPIFFAGMWPAYASHPGSRTQVALLGREGGLPLLTGSADEAGSFRGELLASWVGKKVIVVVREPGFRYDHFTPAKVERWGLFLAIRREKDLVYSGSRGAKAVDPNRWQNWNSTEEYFRASQVVGAATRRAKIAWPLRQFNLVIAIIMGGAGFFLDPAVGLVAGVLAYFGTEWLASDLLRRGY